VRLGARFGDSAGRLRADPRVHPGQAEDGESLQRDVLVADTVDDVRQRWLSATVCAVAFATITACGATSNVAQTHTANTVTTAARAVAGPVGARSYPVDQLSPGHITLAEAMTPQGPVAIALHRIRYFGHVSLCVSETDAKGGSEQSCANYPIGPKSNQNIGNSPVWWASNLLMICAKPHVQVVSGVILRPRITAWLRTPAGMSPTAAVPKAFGVAGGLVYATITAAPDSVTLRDATGKTVYQAPVEPLASFPRSGCGRAPAGAGETSIATVGGSGLTGPGQHVVP